MNKYPIHRAFWPIVFVSALLISFRSDAQVVYGFTGSSLAPTVSEIAGMSASDIAFHHALEIGFSNAQPSAGYAGASGGVNFFTSRPMPGLEVPYLAFTLVPVQGKAVWLHTLSFGARTLVDPPVTGGLGPTGYELRTSADNFVDAVASGTFETAQGSHNYWYRYVMDNLDLKVDADVPLEVRIYLTGASSGSRAGTFRVDDVRAEAVAIAGDIEPWIQYFGFATENLGISPMGRPLIRVPQYGEFQVVSWPFLWSLDLERFLYVTEPPSPDDGGMIWYDWNTPGGWIYTRADIYPWYFDFAAREWRLWQIPATVFYVSPNGNDNWSGRLRTPDSAGQDGPFATIQKARDTVRGMVSGRPVEVRIRGGTYRIEEPLRFEPQDSGHSYAPVTYMAYPGENPIISGGRSIKGLSETSSGFYETIVPEAANRGWIFRQLFAGETRMTLARTPNTGHFRFAGPADPGLHPPTRPREEQYYDAHYFRFHSGQLRDWENISDVNIVAFFSWHAGIIPLTWVDEDSLTFYTFGSMRNTYNGRVGEQMRFYVENSPDCLDAPGEWQLDRQTGQLRLIAEKGQSNFSAEVVAPVAQQLLVLEGNPSADSWVEHIQFKGLSFRHSEFPLPEFGYSDTQAALGVSAAIELFGARNIQFVDNEISQVGNHAVWMRDGSHQIRVERNHLHDLGGGGVYIGNRDAPLRTGENYQIPEHPVGHNVVENNYIHDIGLIYKQSHGVWIGQSSDNVIRHNEIGYTFYSPVAIGWSWSYEPTDTNRNLVEYNYIHNGLQNALPDAGGIYTLGWQQDTVIRGNLIHDIWGYREYQGHGFYPDEGSSGIRYIGNLVFGTSGFSVGINYGRDLTFENNIFALSASGIAIGRGRNVGADGARLTFKRNIFHLNQGRLFYGVGNFQELDRNLYSMFGESIGSPRFPGGASMDLWSSNTGWDTGSLVADPGFVDSASGDFRLRADSPANGLGIEPFDFDKVGLQGPNGWTQLPMIMAEKRSRPSLPAFAHPWPDMRNADGGIKDGFEAGSNLFASSLNPAEEPGPSAPYLRIVLEGPQGIQVRLDRIAFGARSLMPSIIDGSGGPVGYAVRTSADNFEQTIAGGQFKALEGGTNFWHYYDHSISQTYGAIADSLEIRLYLTGANGVSYPGTFRVDDLTVMASTVGSNVEPQLPAILTYRFENESLEPTWTTESLVPTTAIRDDITASELAVVNVSTTGFSRSQASQGYTGASGVVLISDLDDDSMFQTRRRRGDVSVTRELALSGQSSLRMRSTSSDPAVFTYNTLPAAYNLLLDGGETQTVFHLYYHSGQSDLAVRYQDPQGRVGPEIQVHGNAGKLFGNGRELMTIPDETWIRLQINANVGAWNTGRWHLSVVRMDTMEQQNFPELPMDNSFGDWQRLLWRVDAAGGGQQAAFFFDDVRIDTEPNP